LSREYWRKENMKIFRSKRPELSRGYWREKVSDLFGQTAYFPPVETVK
jgi:hypothetical protein